VSAAADLLPEDPPRFLVRNSAWLTPIRTNQSRRPSRRVACPRSIDRVVACVDGQNRRTVRRGLLRSGRRCDRVSGSGSWTCCGMRTRNLGGVFGEQVGSAADTAPPRNRSQLSSSQTVNSMVPRGYEHPRASAMARCLSGKNITPNWQTTSSNESSGSPGVARPPAASRRSGRGAPPTTPSLG